MRVLCAIGVRGGRGVVQRATALIGTHAEFLLLHVIDIRPRQGLEQLKSPLHPVPPPPSPSSSPVHPPSPPFHERELDEAEQASGQEALDEALETAHSLGVMVQAWLERGQPEQIIVQAAERAGVDIIVVQARESGGQPLAGPASVGHIARFVLDHAPCAVLLLRGS